MIDFKVQSSSAWIKYDLYVSIHVTNYDKYYDVSDHLLFCYALCISFALHLLRQQHFQLIIDYQNCFKSISGKSQIRLLMRIYDNL